MDEQQDGINRRNVLKTAGAFGAVGAGMTLPGLLPPSLRQKLQAQDNAAGVLETYFEHGPRYSALPIQDVSADITARGGEYRLDGVTTVAIPADLYSCGDELNVNDVDGVLEGIGITSVEGFAQDAYEQTVNALEHGYLELADGRYELSDDQRETVAGRTPVEYTSTIKAGDKAITLNVPGEDILADDVNWDNVLTATVECDE